MNRCSISEYRAAAPSKVSSKIKDFQRRTKRSSNHQASFGASSFQSESTQRSSWKSGYKLDKNCCGCPKNLQIPEKPTRKLLFARFGTLCEQPSAAIKPMIVTIEADAFSRREPSVDSCYPIFSPYHFRTYQLI